MAKILCIVDSYNWAQAFRAKNLSKFLPHHNFTTLHFKDIKNTNFNNYNIIYPMNWPIHGLISDKIKKKRRYKLVTTVCSHVGRPHASKLRHIFDHYDKISTANLILYKEFRLPYPKKIFYTGFGINIEVFKPITTPSKHFDIFGWSGNPSRSVKRVSDIKNACKKTNATLKIASGGIPFDKMCQWYNSISTAISFSKSEGTPGMLLEAAACGRNIIIPPIGNAPELLKKTKIPMVNSKKELEDQIKYCLKNPDIVNFRGRILRKEIVRNWSWKKRAQAFDSYLFR